MTGAPSLEVDHIREILTTKFTEYDKAINLLQVFANSQPTPGVLGERMTALDRLETERFAALKELMDSHFKELEVRTNALAVSNQKSIDLALQAAKEAAAKSESAFNKQIEALSTQNGQGMASLETRINDTKERVTVIEAGGQGSKQSFGIMITVATLAIGLAGLLVLVLSKLGQ